MKRSNQSDFFEINKHRLEFLYGDDAAKALKRLRMLIERYGVGFEANGGNGEWTEEDSVVITYGDTISKEGEYPLQTLQDFSTEYLADAISGVHILPFFPYSSDDGFSVIDYRTVREDLGDWFHIKRLAQRFRLMADLVINHVSSKSTWFKDYQKDVAPANEYFIEVEEGVNLSNVTRPRSSSLLTEVKKAGEVKKVWTTFSADQIDLDFSNPDVLFEFLDLILYYISQGISVIRLDAIAYLWKKPGTSCIHLPETHEVVRLIRSLLDKVAPHVTLITETNVPHNENIQYFGNGNEAHMIYQFSLPPLLLYTLLNGNASYLTEWADSLDNPPLGCTYFNFTASHDGVGVRPIENLVPQEEFDSLVKAIKDRGGLISMKKNPDGSESPYELNVSYFDAMKDAPESDKDLQIERFLCSQTIQMSLQGVPGIYMHSLTATPNDLKGVEEKGHNRAINRKQWDHDELNALLEDDTSNTYAVFNAYINRLKIRKEQPAFHPEGEQTVLDYGSDYFSLIRTSPEKDQKILSISNITNDEKSMKISDFGDALIEDTNYKNLLGNAVSTEDKTITFEPYETKWLVLE
ncbi:MAG: sugar phosphorylase [Gracilimonas sp.]|nr:sugar phosphorylase [Gracilimonas sp.]